MERCRRQNGRRRGRSQRSRPRKRRNSAKRQQLFRPCCCGPDRSYRRAHSCQGAAALDRWRLTRRRSELWYRRRALSPSHRHSQCEPIVVRRRRPPPPPARRASAAGHRQRRRVTCGPLLDQQCKQIHCPSFGRRRCGRQCKTLRPSAPPPPRRDQSQTAPHGGKRRR